MPVRSWWIRFWLRAKAPLFFGVCFWGFLLAAVFIKTIFSISVIELEGAASLKGLNSLKKRWFFLLSSSKEANRLYRVNADVAAVSVKKIYPNRIIVTVERGETLAQLVGVEGYFSLSQRGRVTAQKKDRDVSLPLINHYQRLHLIDYPTGSLLTNKEILFSLFFIQRLGSDGVGVDEVDINGSDMLVLKSAEHNYFFTSGKDKNLQYEDFKTISQRLKIENIDYVVLDLRFEKPIIKTSR